MVGALFDALVYLWSLEMTWVAGVVTSRCPLSCFRVQVAPWFTGELQVITSQGKLLTARATVEEDLGQILKERGESSF